MDLRVVTPIDGEARVKANIRDTAEATGLTAKTLVWNALDQKHRLRLACSAHTHESHPRKPGVA